MRRVYGAIVVMAALAVGAPAAAQQAGHGPDEPIINLWYAGVSTGAAVAEKSSGFIGAEAGARLWRNLDGVASLSWTGNAATGRQIDNIDRLATALGADGASTSGSIKMPVTYIGAGARWVFENSGRYRPYVLTTLGVARTNLKPSLSVNGVNVTGDAAAHGVTLGRDLAGKYSRFGVEAGIGFLMGFGSWYVDVGGRIQSISLEDHQVNVAKFALGGGYRF